MPSSVKVFALSTCVHCENTKKYLDDQGVAYECVHVDRLWPDERNQVMEEVRKYNPAFSFPTVVIDGKVIVGFNLEEIAEALKL